MFPILLGRDSSIGHQIVGFAAPLRPRLGMRQTIHDMANSTSLDKDGQQPQWDAIAGGIGSFMRRAGRISTGALE